MFLSLTTRRLSIVLLIASFVFAPEVSGAEITKRVAFAKGKRSVSYKGKLTREYAYYDSYLLRAKKGQTLTVKLTTEDADASFAVYETNELGPDEDTILPQNATLRAWTGELPITSEYSVQVYGVTSSDDREDSGAPYTVEISLR